MQPTTTANSTYHDSNPLLSIALFDANTWSAQSAFWCIYTFVQMRSDWATLPASILIIFGPVQDEYQQIGKLYENVPFSYLLIITNFLCFIVMKMCPWINHRQQVHSLQELQGSCIIVNKEYEWSRYTLESINVYEESASMNNLGVNVGFSHL